MLREVELSLARIHHLSFSRGPLGFLEVTWLLPASKMDPGAVGISRAHGCSCGTCVLGAPPASLDDSASSLPLSLTLCPTRAAARQVLHAQELRSLLSTSDPFGPWSLQGEFPLFPTLAGLTLDKVAVVGTVVEAARGLGIPHTDPDGRERFGGHSLRVGGAQSLSRAGIESRDIALLARWGSSTVLEYIQDAPLGRSHLVAGRAVREWGGGAPVVTNFQHGASPISACPPLLPPPVPPPFL